MKTKLLIFLILTSFEVIGSTPQIPDKLIYQGAEYEWNGYSPAVDYFEKKYFKAPKEAIETTANYGIFIFTYSIEQDCLYLTDVKILVSIGKDDGPPELGDKSVFKLYFPNTDKVLMKNYSGLQVTPYGDQISQIRKERTFLYYKNYFVFDIEKGVVNIKLDLNLREYQKLIKDQFEKRKNSPEYIQLAKRNRQNLIYFNESREEKFTMDEYLEMNILDNINHLQ